MFRRLVSKEWQDLHGQSYLSQQKGILFNLGNGAANVKTFLEQSVLEKTRNSGSSHEFTDTQCMVVLPTFGLALSLVRTCS